jgi:hypothetical protein
MSRIMHAAKSRSSRPERLITVKVVSPLKIYSIITNTHELDEIEKN